MLTVLSWWLIMEIIGLLALPLTLRLLRHLPERGYAFAKPFGLLLSGYLLWIGASFGFLSNTRTAIAFVILLVGLASLIIWQHDFAGTVAFVSQNWHALIATELVFALAFFGWAFVRAYNPEIAATEKPMEIAFLNAILRSERFPPHDPWLSGFAISYYYFGYLLMAMLTKLSGVPSSVAFNLAIALLFAITATGSFSLVYNLLATYRGQRGRGGWSGIFWALLGPLFVVIIGNLEGIFEVLHTRGLGSPGFWQWLDVQGLIDAPINKRWIPTDMWWWWRASRVVNDRDLQGVHMEVIDEFPQFSFLLGDMHPHVLALPFVLLALALAFNLLLGAYTWLTEAGKRQDLSQKEENVGLQILFFKAWHSLLELWQKHAFDLIMLALCLGALGFLNTWDFPIHLFVVAAAFLTGQRMQRCSRWLASTAVFTLSLAVPAALLYLPFYLGFQSQAGGALPLLFNTTRLHQYLLMFGLFVFVIASLIVLQLGRAITSVPREQRREFCCSLLFDALNLFLWLLAGSLLLMTLAALSVMATAAGREFLRGVLADMQVKVLFGNTDMLGLLRQAVFLRLTNPWTFLLLAALIALLLCLIQRTWKCEITTRSTEEAALVFIYLIAGTAFLLTFIVEFVYLRDSFGTRMNTVFKFYYQAWVMMSIAAAFGSYYVLARGERSKSIVSLLMHRFWLVAFTTLVLLSLVYPVLAIPNKTGSFKGKPTLDGMAFLKDARPDDYEAIKWLQANVQGIAYIVEATGGSYSDAAFVSAFTGLPTILGWGFHEQQWRGNYIEAGKREPDIAQIYQSSDAKQVLTLLDKYDIKYVYVGGVEKRKYELSPDATKHFERFLEKVFEQGSVSIYRR